MKLKYLPLIFAIAVLSSCENRLDINPKSELTYNGFWEDENGAQAAHTGLYGAFRSEASNLFLLGEIRSDVWGGPTTESPSSHALIQNNINVSNAPFGGWAGFYSNIHQVNDFIENVPDIEFQDESEKKHFMGEAYGMRAFYYYTLLKTWGKVPLNTEAFSFEGAEGLSKERAPKEEVMQQIKADIDSSLTAFGQDDSFWDDSRNYWSKAATLTLKGDVYIWSGKILNGGDADFSEAKKALEEVMGIGNVGLVADYSDLWGSDHENNQEFIFSLSYKEDEAGNMFNSFTGRSTEIYQTYDDQGESLEGMVISGANRYGPSIHTLEISDDNRDARKEATFIRMFDDSNNEQGYPDFNEDKYVASILNKFLGREDGSERIFDGDYPIYRYADVLLLMAEAKNDLGEDPSAEINHIRERAYGEDYDSSLTYSNQSQHENTEAILKERYLEFIAEGKRWWDLRRAGDQYVIEHNDYLEPGDEYKLQLPITPDMIGRNGKLKQTEGYK